MQVYWHSREHCRPEDIHQTSTSYPSSHPGAKTRPPYHHHHRQQQAPPTTTHQSLPPPRFLQEPDSLDMNSQAPPGGHSVFSLPVYDEIIVKPIHLRFGKRSTLLHVSEHAEQACRSIIQPCLGCWMLHRPLLMTNFRLFLHPRDDPVLKTGSVLCFGHQVYLVK